MTVLHDPASHPRVRRSWFARLSGLAWIILAFELGLFLLIYPWMDGWSTNDFAHWREGWRDLWLSPYLRGAISGLGLVNISISLRGLYRFLRELLFD